MSQHETEKLLDSPDAKKKEAIPATDIRIATEMQDVAGASTKTSPTRRPILKRSWTTPAHGKPLPAGKRAKLLPYTVKRPSPLRQTWNSSDVDEEFQPPRRRLKTFGSEGDIFKAMCAHDPFADIAHHIQPARSRTVTAESSPSTWPTTQATVECFTGSSQQVDMGDNAEEADDWGSDFSDADDDISEAVWLHGVMEGKLQEVSVLQNLSRA